MSEEEIDHYSPDVPSSLSHKSKSSSSPTTPELPTGSDSTGTLTTLADFPQPGILSISEGASGSASPSEPEALHARELEAAHALWYSNTQATLQEDTKEAELNNDAESSEKMDPDEMKWDRDHPILVRDYAFDEDDERFSKVPPELMPPSDRPNQDSLTRGTELGSSRFLFETRFDRTFVSPGAQPRFGFGHGGDGYDDDDEWGWPMGTFTGEDAHAELQNRSRAWNALPGREVGGSWKELDERQREISKGESSGFYEEDGEELEETEMLAGNGVNEVDDIFEGGPHPSLQSSSYCSSSESDSSLENGK
jgi:hypothetical protein